MKEHLEEITVGLNSETNERLIAQNLSEIFKVGRYEQKFRKTEVEDLEGQLIRLMDLFWQNRGRRDGLEIFNEKYYQNFFKAREAIINQLVKLNEEIETRRQGTDDESLKDILAELKKELNNFDERNENSESDRLGSKGIEDRQRTEWQLTKVIAALTQNLEPDEFAVVMFEQLEQTFAREKTAVADQKVSNNEKKRAELILSIVSMAVDKWTRTHEGGTR